MSLSACQNLGEPPPGAADRLEVEVVPAADERICDDAPFEAFSLDPSLLDTDDVDCDPETEAYCYSLRSDLREVAAAADPRLSLARAAEAFDDHAASGAAEDLARARALADLAVTGAAAYAAFAAAPPLAEDLDTTASSAGRADAIERAYEVAWALRGPAPWRSAARAELGPVAVSAEDDPPARPVNIPSGPFPQSDLTLDVPLADGGRLAFRTRVLVASTETEARATVPADRVGLVPLEGGPEIPQRGPVILFVPGHSSLAEEGAPLAAALVDGAAQRGEALTVVMFDLPSNAYADRIDPNAIIDAANGAKDALLRFHDDTIEALVGALEMRQPGLSSRIVAAVGGSLGGNLVLRIGERSAPWAPRLVAWSPASVDFSWERARWPLAAGDGEFVDLVKHEAVRMTRNASEEDEEHDARRDYFVGGLSSVRKQASYWYRNGWACKDATIREGLLQLGEIYDERFRRWHYRVAYEQLVFSHLEPDDDGTRPYERIEAPLLLVAGEQDDSVPMQTRFFVDRLGEQLEMEGETLFLEDTGHALHSERPRLLADHIARFLEET